MSAQPTVLLLGNARCGEFESLRADGRRVGLIRDVTNHGLCAPASDFDLIIDWDPRAGIGPLLGPVGDATVLNLRESYVEPHAALAVARGEAAMGEEQVAALRSKALMRAAFRSAIGPDATGRVAAATSAAHVIAFGEQHGWPVIVKPEALYSSLFVTLVSSAADVPATFAEIRDGIAAHVRAKGLPARFTRMQVEQYLTGSNHSVDLVVSADGEPFAAPVVDVLTTRDLGGPDFSHVARFSPSRASDDDQRAMRDLAGAAVRALGLRRCAAHVEFVLTPAGPRLLEAAVRPGGHRIRMLGMGHGIDFPAAYLAVCEGRTPDLAPRWERPFAIVTPFPSADGRFTGVPDVAPVTALPTYRSHAVHLPVGAQIGRSTTGHWQVMAIELSGSADAIARDVAALAALDLVRAA